MSKFPDKQEWDRSLIAAKSFKIMMILQDSVENDPGLAHVILINCLSVLCEMHHDPQIACDASIEALKKMKSSLMRINDEKGR